MKPVEKACRNSRSFFVFILMINLVFLASISVGAHSPSDMSLSYDESTAQLHVSGTHEVSDPSTHYVYIMSLKINGVVFNTREFANQSGNSFTYTFYNVEAVEGDVLEVTAYCNQGGSITRELTVGSETDSDTEGGGTPGFELVLFIVSAVFLIVFIRRRRVV